MSSDACNTNLLQSNYEHSIQDAIHNTISFLLHLHGSGNPIYCLPCWTLAEFLKNLNSLSNAVLKWALERVSEAESVVKLLVERDDIDVNLNHVGLTPLSWAAKGGHEVVVKLLIGRDDVDVNSKNANSKKPGRTPLSWRKLLRRLN